VRLADDLPNRDCNAKASLGEISDSSQGADAALQQYQQGYIDPFAAVLAEYSQVCARARAQTRQTAPAAAGPMR
jgi:cellulase/cellobiase CelA1